MVLQPFQTINDLILFIIQSINIHIVILSILDSQMSHHKNWNDMSSSEEEEQQNDHSQHKPQETTLSNQPSSSTKPNQDDHPQPASKPSEPETVAATKKTYLSDEQLLEQYANHRVDDSRRIKVVNCFHQDNKDIVKGIKDADIRELKEGMFLLRFEKEEGCLQFIRDKISNRWRFFLQPYHVKKRDDGPRGGQREQKRENRGQAEIKGEKKQEADRQAERKPRRQRRYQREESPPPQKQDKQPRRGRQEDKPLKNEEDHGKKTYKARESFELNAMKSHLKIQKDYFEIPKVFEQLQSKGIFKSFAKIHIFAPVQWLPKVSQLCLEIASRKQYFIEEPKEIPHEGEVQLKLTERKGSLAATQAFHDRYNHGKKGAVGPSPAGSKKEEKVIVVPSRKLGADFESYFEDIGKSNLSQLVDGFDEDQFVRRLREESAVIFDKHWKVWRLQAFDQRIQRLLKLVHRLTKSTIYDVELKPSMRDGSAILTAQIQPRPEKDRRPKVDFSGINGYLSL